jgi:hypothetical protein
VCSHTAREGIHQSDNPYIPLAIVCTLLAGVIRVEKHSLHLSHSALIPVAFMVDRASGSMVTFQRANPRKRS